MLLRRIKTVVDNNVIQLNLMGVDVAVLRGRTSSEVLCVVEYLLSSDFTEVDGSDISYIIFENGGNISGVGGCVTKNGDVPNIHCISCSDVSSIRSICITEDLRYCSTDNDMTKYSLILPMSNWLYLISLVNRYLGYEFVNLEDGKLVFDFDTDCRFEKDYVKFIYVLISECFLTPVDYKRVVLLSGLSGISSEDKLRLLEILCSISNHGVVFLEDTTIDETLYTNSSVNVFNL